MLTSPPSSSGALFRWARDLDRERPTTVSGGLLALDAGTPSPERRARDLSTDLRRMLRLMRRTQDDYRSGHEDFERDLRRRIEAQRARLSAAADAAIVAVAGPAPPAAQPIPGTSAYDAIPGAAVAPTVAAEDEAWSSGYREVQGIDADAALKKLKRRLLRQVYNENLRFQRLRRSAS